MKMSPIRNTGQDYVAKMLRMMQKLRLSVCQSAYCHGVVLSRSNCNSCVGEICRQNGVAFKTTSLQAANGQIFAALCCLFSLH
jgi:hypothetical protein